jgi:acyl-coenzyme A synthetase/AMP-(fatty) acid ligase
MVVVKRLPRLTSGKPDRRAIRALVIGTKARG